MGGTARQARGARGWGGGQAQRAHDGQVCAKETWGRPHATPGGPLGLGWCSPWALESFSTVPGRHPHPLGAAWVSLGPGSHLGFAGEGSPVTGSHGVGDRTLQEYESHLAGGLGPSGQLSLGGPSLVPDLVTLSSHLVAGGRATGPGLCSMELGSGQAELTGTQTPRPGPPRALPEGSMGFSSQGPS